MSEYRAARAALTGVQRASLGHGSFLQVNVADLSGALDNLQRTYFLRLAAETERMMRKHLKRFPTVRLGSQDGFRNLIGRVAKHFDPNDPLARMPPHLVAEVLTLVAFRNDQAHALGLPLTPPTLDGAAIVLRRFLNSLP